MFDIQFNGYTVFPLYYLNETFENCGSKILTRFYAISDAK